MPASPAITAVNGWQTYSIALISAGVALLIPLALKLLSKWFSRGVPHPASTWPTEFPVPAPLFAMGERVNTRFLLAANLCLGLIGLMLMLIPCIGNLQPGADSQNVLRAVVAIVSIAAFAAIGLFYFGRKGDLEWVRSFARSGRDEP